MKRLVKFKTPSKENSVFRVEGYRYIALKLFGKFLSGRSRSSDVELNLRKAKLGMGRVEFHSQVALSVLIAIAVSIPVGIFISILYPHLAFLTWAILFLAVATVLAVLLEMPEAIARYRKRKIDSVITLASGFFATMASANIPIDIIIRDLGESRQYGEISREARSTWYRSTLFGMDIISSIKETIKSTPSQKFSEFLQGIVTSVSSGGDLKQYFITKAEQFQGELSSLIKQNSNSMGILAESFVTVGVAFPLILLIIVGVIAFLSPSSPGGLISVLVLTVALILPAVFLIFGYFFRATVGEIEL